MQSNGFAKVTFLTGCIFAINFVFVWVFMASVEQVKGHSSMRQEQVLIDDENEKTANGKMTEHKNGELEYDKLHIRHLTPSKVADTSSSSINSIHKISSMNSTLDLLVIRFVMGFSMLVFRSKVNNNKTDCTDVNFYSDHEVQCL